MSLDVPPLTGEGEVPIVPTLCVEISQLEGNVGEGKTHSGRLKKIEASGIVQTENIGDLKFSSFWSIHCSELTASLQVFLTKENSTHGIHNPDRGNPTASVWGC